MEHALRWRIGVGAAAVLVGGAVVGAVVTQAGVPHVAPAVVADAVEASPATILVDVQGAVVRPGVYALADGARVVDALARAGGATADADPSSLNLAQALVDGAQVRVPVAGEVPPGAIDAAGIVSLNAATVDELDTLPRIGPALAGAIVAHRDEHGPFAAIADLDAVPGIGPALLAHLEPLVTL
jgi:competence protein ComEA